MTSLVTVTRGRGEDAADEDADGMQKRTPDEAKETEKVGENAGRRSLETAAPGEDLSGVDKVRPEGQGGRTAGARPERGVGEAHCHPWFS